MSKFTIQPKAQKKQVNSSDSSESSSDDVPVKKVQEVKDCNKPILTINKKSVRPTLAGEDNKWTELLGAQINGKDIKTAVFADDFSRTYKKYVKRLDKAFAGIEGVTNPFAIISPYILYCEAIAEVTIKFSKSGE